MKEKYLTILRDELNDLESLKTDDKELLERIVQHIKGIKQEIKEVNEW